MWRKLRNLTVLFCLAGLVAGTFCACGYHSPYAESLTDGSEKPTIFLSVWKNKTNELGFDGEILQRITDWLQESKHLVLTTDRESADFVLTGSIDSIRLPVTAFNSNDRAVSLKARVETSYQLIRNKTGEKVRQTQFTVREATYSVAGDAVRSGSNRRDALARIANDIGEQIYLEVFYAVTNHKK